MANELDIARYGIAKLIKDGGLCVPRNQREYAWCEEHVMDLYQNLAKAIADGEPDYFLGSVVVAKKNGTLEVFDGQQRLATTVILLAAIRDYYRDTSDHQRANIIEAGGRFLTAQQSGGAPPFRVCFLKGWAILLLRFPLRSRFEFP